jgi:PAS domain S-box-containing protein
MRTAEHQILLIEDSPTDVTLLRAALARARAATYQLAVVAGLEEGLGRLAQEPVDAIVLDLGRTDSQGLERLRRLHAVAGDIPIVALAGWMDATAAERAVQAGAQEYVVKDTTGWASIPCIIHYAIERRRLIQLHKASENRFAIAFHHSPTGQAITTIHEGRFIDVNAAFCHMLGYQREEVIGRTTLELAIWADPEVRRAAFASFHREGSIQNWEVVFRTRTGDLRNILASVAPLEIDGEACAISTALDITARKRAADALQQSEARHRLISSAISDYVYSELVYADGRTRTEWVSGAFERITGYALEEVNAMPYGFLSLILADDAALIADRVSNLLDLPAAAIEYRIRRKDGEIRWVRDSMQQAPGAGGGRCGAARWRRAGHHRTQSGGGNDPQQRTPDAGVGEFSG